jgi:hypothetical protein
MPDNRFPSDESVIRADVKPNQVNVYVPPAQATVAVPLSLWVVLLSGCTVTVTPLDQSHDPKIGPQPPEAFGGKLVCHSAREGTPDVDRSSLPDADLSRLPTTPPVEPAWPIAGAFATEIKNMTDVTAVPIRGNQDAIRHRSFLKLFVIAPVTAAVARRRRKPMQ